MAKDKALLKVKIFYHHTDCRGSVNCFNYPLFLEEARTEFFAQRGIMIKELMREGLFFVVAREELNFHGRSFYADTLDVYTWVSEVASARIVFKGEIRRPAGSLIVEAKTVLVGVNEDFRPKVLPRQWKEIFCCESFS